MSGPFQTTHWSVVVAAGRAAGGQGRAQVRAALETLCSAYWYPLYAYARRRGHDAEQARDLTQGFFAELLEKDGLAAADPARGRFRAFLITAFKRYDLRQRERARALKRGGGRPVVSLDAMEGEKRYNHEPVDPLTPERLFERRWALTVLERTLEKVRGIMENGGKAELFECLQPYLSGDDGVRPMAETASRLGMSEGAVKTAVHRLRRRYRDELRREIAETLAQPSPEKIDQEIAELQAALQTQ